MPSGAGSGSLSSGGTVESVGTDVGAGVVVDVVVVGQSGSQIVVVVVVDDVLDVDSGTVVVVVVVVAPGRVVVVVVVVVVVGGRHVGPGSVVVVGGSVVLVELVVVVVPVGGAVVVVAGTVVVVVPGGVVGGTDVGAVVGAVLGDVVGPAVVGGAVVVDVGCEVGGVVVPGAASGVDVELAMDGSDVNVASLSSAWAADGSAAVRPRTDAASATTDRAARCGRRVRAWSVIEFGAPEWARWHTPGARLSARGRAVVSATVGIVAAVSEQPPVPEPPDVAADAETSQATAPQADGGRAEAQRDAAEPDPYRDTRPEAILAVDIGASKFATGLMTMRGSLIDRSRVETERDVGPQSHFAALAGIVQEQLDRAERHHKVRVRAIGVASAGPIERGCETVSPIGLESWRRFPLRQHLADLTGLPVHGDLDARALALAEGWLGAAKGLDSFAAMIVSTGIGGGFVIDGKLLEGASGNAGQVGHIIVEPGGRRCQCGARGCLEAEASGYAIETITGRSTSEPTYDIMRRTGKLVGRAAGMICNALDLDLVVVGGAVALGFAATFYNAAQEEIDEVAKVGVGARARITPARLGDQGSLIGAGAVGLRGLRRDGR